MRNHSLRILNLKLEGSVGDDESSYELDLLDLFILVDVGTERSESVRW